MSVIKLSSLLSSSTVQKSIFALHKAESSSFPSSLQVVCLAVFPPVWPSLQKWWLYFGCIWLDFTWNSFSVCAFVLAKQVPKQIPHNFVREESADPNFVLGSLFTATMLPRWFVHKKNPPFFTCIFFLQVRTCSWIRILVFLSTADCLSPEIRQWQDPSC